MKRENKSRTIGGLRRSVIKFTVTWICAAGIFNLLGVPVAPALAEMNRGASIALGAGAMHFCAVMSDGTVQCWKHIAFDELGDRMRPDSLVPVTISGITNAVAVSGRCAILADGRVQCWRENSAAPVTMTGITNAVTITGSCAVLADGRVQCWDTDKLDEGTTSSSSVSVNIRGITNAVAVSRGGGYTCAVLADGRVQCWGHNAQGELGNGTTTNSSVPVNVSGITNAVAVAASTCNYTCAVLADGYVQCWGHNLHFAVPRMKMNTYASSLVPVTVKGITNAVAVVALDPHPCVVLADGRVQCWGFFGSGGGGMLKTSAPVTLNTLGKSVRVSTKTTR